MGCYVWYATAGTGQLLQDGQSLSKVTSTWGVMSLRYRQVLRSTVHTQRRATIRDNHLLVWRRLLTKPTICVTAPVRRGRSGIQNGHGGAGAGSRLQGLLSRPAAEPALAPGGSPALAVWLALRPGIPVSRQPRRFATSKLHCV